MKRVLFLLAVLVLAGCATQKRCGKKFPAVASIHDTLIVEKIVIKRDTVVQFKIKTDTVKEWITIEVPAGVLVNTPEHRLNTRYAYSIARIVNNRLLHQLVQHDAVIEQVIKDAIQETISSTTQHTASFHVVEVNKFTGFQWFQIWLGRILAGFLFVVLFIFLVKKYLNL